MDYYKILNFEQLAGSVNFNGKLSGIKTVMKYLPHNQAKMNQGVEESDLPSTSRLYGPLM